MSGSILSLFIPFPTLSVSASAEFSLMLSAIAAILIGLFYADAPMRSVNLRWLAIGLTVFIAYSLVTTLPVLITGTWTDMWGPMAWFGHSVCFSVLLAMGTLVVVRQGEVDIDDLQTTLAAILFISLLFVRFPSTHLQMLLSYASAENPFGLFYSTRLAAFWCVIGLAISSDSLIKTPIFLGCLFLCESATAWIVVIALFFMRVHSVRNIALMLVAVILAVVTQPYFKNALPYVQLRLENWQAVVTTILHNPLGIGSNPLSYSAAMAKYGLLPHASSDILSFTLQYGWLAAIGLFLAIRALIQSPASYAKPALICIVLFSAIQTSISYGHNAMLAWMVLCAWLIEGRVNGTPAQV